MDQSVAAESVDASQDAAAAPAVAAAAGYPVPPGKRSPRVKYGLTDLAVLLPVLVLCLLFVRPLLEEWDFYGCRSMGLDAATDKFLQVLQTASTRPLLTVPLFIGCAIGDGAWWGWALLKFGLISATYGTARWALTPYANASINRLVAALAMVLVPWPAIWSGRYLPAQTSALLVLVSVGHLLRAAGSEQGRWRSTAWSGAFAFMAMATYQGPVVALAGAPVLVGLFWPGRISPRNARSWLGTFGGPWLGMGVYALAALGVSAAVALGGPLENPYEARLLEGGSASIIPSLLRLWDSAYASSVGIGVPLIAWLILAASWALLTISNGWLARRPRLVGGALLLAILGLPAVAVPYAAHPHLAGDPDRVWFAIGAFTTVVGIIMVASASASASAGSPGMGQLGQEPGVRGIPVGAILHMLIVPVLGFAALGAYAFGSYGELQARLLQSTEAALADAPAGPVMVRDHTGLLGDIYTLLPVEVSVALNKLHPDSTFSLCTVAGVDRVHPRVTEINEGAGYATAICDPAAAGTSLDVTKDATGHLQTALSFAPLDVTANALQIDPDQCRETGKLGAGGNVPEGQLKGFSSVESGGRWTDGPQASLTCQVPAQWRGQRLEVTVVTSGSFGSEPQNVEITAAGSDLKSAVPNLSDTPSPLTLKTRKLDDESLSIVLSLPDAHSPQSEGVSTDPRSLGLFVNEVRIAVVE